MDILGGLLFIVGFVGLFSGELVFIIVIIIGWIIMGNELNKVNDKKNNNSNDYLIRENKNNIINNSSKNDNATVKQKDNIIDKNDNATVKQKDNIIVEKDMEVYVIVRFDNYPKLYTYLAPINRFLKSGDRVKIMTNNGEIKYVTVVKGNHKCPKKTDRYYSRLTMV